MIVLTLLASILRGLEQSDEGLSAGLEGSLQLRLGMLKAATTAGR